MGKRYYVTCRNSRNLFNFLKECKNLGIAENKVVRVKISTRRYQGVNNAVLTTAPCVRKMNKKF